MGEFLFPDVEGGFADTELPADFGHGPPAFDFAEGNGDLLLREL